MPRERHAPLSVALLATPVTTGATLFGMLDLLAGATRDWEALMHGRTVDGPIRPFVATADGAPLSVANGVRIVPDAAFERCATPDVVCVTDMMVLPGTVLDDTYEPAVRWIRRCHAEGATIASACSGAVLLARTGLLDAQDATSHWAYCEALGRQYPSTRWRPEMALVTAGEGHRLVMAGSGTSWHALALYLVARFVRAEAAMQLARLNILDWNTTSPLAYAAMAHVTQVDDPVIARCQAWVAEHYADDAPVAGMVRASGLPERTFQRRFAAATGHSPLDYVHTLRLEEAKQMLEADDAPIERVAFAVGYQDAGFFARLFRRKVGLTPAQYRRRFGALALRLGAAQAELAAGAAIASRDLAGRQAPRLPS